MTAKMNIICCGNVAFDLISPGNNTKSYIPFHARPGGSVFNTATLLARLGFRVSMLTKVGDDFLGNALLEVMRTERIKTKYAVKDKTVRTNLALAKIDKKGDSSYDFYKSKGKDAAFKKSQIPSVLFKKTDIFHTASAYTYDDCTFENTLDLMKRAKKENVFVSYDPNWREARIKNKKLTRSRVKKLLPYVNLLKLSKQDALGITEAKTLSSSLKHLPKNTIITLGGKGSFLWNGKKKIFQPAFKVKVIDTIGAGDGFTAGLVYRYSLLGAEFFKKDIKETLRFASAVSALVCTGRGAGEGLRNLQQIEGFLKAWY